MTSATSRRTGLLGPVALSVGVLLLLAAPLMRGGNRSVALIPLELLGLAVMLGLWLRWAMTRPSLEPERPRNRILILLLVCSPLLRALVQLAPLPAELWARLPGRAVYIDTLKAIG